jgi:acyl-coenzyme A thioesterase PaaI-like protein
MTSVESTTVTYEEIGPRICVTPPYYALEDLVSPAPGLASATVPVQTPTGRQLTHINLAEGGRHLAILGLCAAASVNPRAGQHYYLAHRGIGRMYPPAKTLTTLRGTASARMSGRNRALAETELHDADGNLVARLDLEYLVLSVPVFRRLMGPAAEPDAMEPASPYSAPAPLTDVAVDARRATAKLSVEAATCRGHFAGYPALPVSVAGYASFALFDHVLGATTGPDARWQAGRYQLVADHLASAGETCTVDVEPSAPVEPEAHDKAFTGTLRSGDREVFTIQVDYTEV